MRADDPMRSVKEKLAWCAVACATACRAAQTTRTHFTATNDLLQNSVSSSAAADIPDFVAVDLCARSTLDSPRCPSDGGQ